MVDHIRILSARRAYEFQLDDLRLTLLSVAEVRQRIEASFTFQASEIGTPMETFGPVPKTLPPGLVFNWGAVPFPEGAITPIRFLHFEQRRVVIDVAGPSSAIDLIFEHLRQILADLRAPDGTPAIGEPVSKMDTSEIVAHLDFPQAALLPPAVRAVFERMLGASEGNGANVPMPMLRVHGAASGKEYAGTPTRTHQVFSFDLRAGNLPEARIYFSSAPLDTDAHLAYLRELESALSHSSPLAHP